MWLVLMGQFLWFNSHNIVELNIRGVSGHGLGLVRGISVTDLTLGETLIVLADGLNHGWYSARVDAPKTHKKYHFYKFYLMS